MPKQSKKSLRGFTLIRTLRCKNLIRVQHGFTLIELLITITLIGILSGIIAIAMIGPQRNARNAKRESDVELIRSGLEIYNADCGSYPPTDSVVGNGTLFGNGSSCLASNKYISKVPVDPSNGSSYTYNRTATSTYTLCATLEPSGSYCVANP